MPQEDYTIGKGKVLFKKDGTNGFVELGNCPNFALNISVESLEHFSSESGIQTKDMEVITKQLATGSMTLDEPNIDNLRRFIMADSADDSDLSQTASTVSDEAVTTYHDKWVDLSKSGLSSVVVQDVTDSTTYTVDVDYVLDVKKGMIKVLSTGSILDTAVLHVDFSYSTKTITKIFGATATTIKGILYFIGDPPQGRILDVLGYVSMKPEGDLGLISEEWSEMAFTMEFLQNAAIANDALFELTDRGSIDASVA
jgi:hypothetical protein